MNRRKIANIDRVRKDRHRESMYLIRGKISKEYYFGIFDANSKAKN